MSSLTINIEIPTSQKFLTTKIFVVCFYFYILLVHGAENASSFVELISGYLKEQDREKRKRDDDLIENNLEEFYDASDISSSRSLDETREVYDGKDFKFLAPHPLNDVKQKIRSFRKTPEIIKLKERLITHSKALVKLPKETIRKRAASGNLRLNQKLDLFADQPQAARSNSKLANYVFGKESIIGSGGSQLNEKTLANAVEAAMTEFSDEDFELLIIFYLIETKQTIFEL